MDEQFNAEQFLQRMRDSKYEQPYADWFDSHGGRISLLRDRCSLMKHFQQLGVGEAFIYQDKVMIKTETDSFKSRDRDGQEAPPNAVCLGYSTWQGYHYHIEDNEDVQPTEITW